MFDIKFYEFIGVKCATQSHDIWLQYDLDFIVTALRIAVLNVAGHAMPLQVKVNLQQDVRSLVHRVFGRRVKLRRWKREVPAFYLDLLPVLAPSSRAPTPFLFLHYIMPFFLAQSESCRHFVNPAFHGLLFAISSPNPFRPSLRSPLPTPLVFSHCRSRRAALLLVNTKNRDIWPDSIF